MTGGLTPEIVVSNWLDKAKTEIFSYIETNTEAIDENFPAFFGKVATILERANVPIPDQVHDEFIDAVAYQVFAVSKRAGDPRFVSRVCDIACGMKRKKERKAGVHLAAAVKLMKIGMPLAAAAYLRPYWRHDATVGCWYAYCHYILYKEGSTEPGYSVAERWNYLKSAHQYMDDLGRLRPGLQRLVRGELEQDTWLAEPFWTMIFLSTEWFPDNPWFLQIGILRAKQDRNNAALVKVLQIALVRFPDEISFYREAYHLKFEQGDLGDTLSFVHDMLEKFPGNHEPIYYGLRTALHLPRDAEYNYFRALAEESKMPRHVLHLINYVHALLRGRQGQAALCLDEFRRKYPSLNYYSDLLWFITIDAPIRADGANLAIITSVDNFCRRMLKIGET
ncbi:MAG TPA: hypothetical protein PKK74_09735 [Candidatus Methanoculleus thermohydrogenotrophicum]|jgi:hypothetical protein|nr:hypothetical protein [Candidatus Methanoculleus thermohydrogenotrophicum]NLM82204.1 hypothetical protein [Candidatus Methanoculleus thermohydrogenotrophicum]HOB18952.1 hypothetical protein [Candidatus Methanoculleus thermohydrogenotrophicum]HPZ39000.1 hypothetical protein [Candidatus Methanoculleus thermohydrogenotrophicum]HQC92099.1 hypothetical protein [Candidatus Methanoculleus thermohydrogenotrophicum]